MRKPRPDRRGRSPAGAGALATQLRTDVLAALALRTGDRALAEDLAQEALLRVVAGLPHFRGQAALRTWTRRIADNVWRDHLRRRRANPVEPAGVEARDPAAPPEAAHDRRVTRECLLDAVFQLPLGERSVVLLHDLGDIPLLQVATTLGCTLAAAKQRLWRGRRRLADACRQQCTHDTAADGSGLCTRKASRQGPPARAGRGAGGAKGEG